MVPTSLGGGTDTDFQSVDDGLPAGAPPRRSCCLIHIALNGACKEGMQLKGLADGSLDDDGGSHRRSLLCRNRLSSGAGMG
ncbi:hypothetical protein GCM10007175_36970 [Pseudarthrobacter scleromae]|uniref:Uncharacterized protein n=1 Tax=Pseudarthrobacter scleromae TaxID=158897 RepID=A0ABQ2CM49_9MICC|nr:hypothetical protein GCM10007175_36970 [Pseudarthrobacter scleromae]